MKRMFLCMSNYSSVVMKCLYICCLIGVTQFRNRSRVLDSFTDRFMIFYCVYITYVYISVMYLLGVNM